MITTSPILPPLLDPKLLASEAKMTGKEKEAEAGSFSNGQQNLMEFCTYILRIVGCPESLG